MLGRTFGCVRVVWNRTLAARHARFAAEGKSTSYAQADLAVANMVRNRSLAKSISRTGWAEFRAMLEYKAQRYGRTVAVADRWYPSSKTCSACGHLLAELSLGTRHWACPGCGTRHDRDVNAARNMIAAAGLAAPACGADVRHGGATPVQSAVKQEPQRATAGIPVLQGGE
jgi:putative transposase